MLVEVARRSPGKAEQYAAFNGRFRDTVRRQIPTIPWYLMGFCQMSKGESRFLVMG